MFKNTGATIIVAGALALLTLTSCGGGGGTVATTGLNYGNGTGQTGHNGDGTVTNGGVTVSGDPTVSGGGSNSDTAIHLPGGGTAGQQGGNGSHPFPFSPAVTAPPAEHYKDVSAAGDGPREKWLKNVFEPLPAGSSPSRYYQNASLKQWADEIFAGVNAQRAAAGLSVLKRADILDAAAQAHARDNALRNYFNHTTIDGPTTWDRWAFLNMPNYGQGGENSAMGQESVSEVITDWMNSSGHRKIMMNPAYTHLGIGVYFDDSNYNYPIHVLADFAEFRVDPATASWYKRGSVFTEK